ncbi:hypothetical protein F4774DRAFT_424428 [Daldinia eschscholtzii]|nr:hypothetical protein F4774DRAFT_424428 [Daldinia eschscholtzii]
MRRTLAFAVIELEIRVWKPHHELYVNIPRPIGSLPSVELLANHLSAFNFLFILERTCHKQSSSCTYGRLSICFESLDLSQSAMTNHRDYLSLNFWDLAGGGFQANDPGMEYTQGFVQQQQQQQQELENPVDSDSGLSNLGLMGNDNHSSVAGDNSYATPHSMTPQPEGQGVIQRSTLRTDDRSTGDSQNSRSASGKANSDDNNWTYAIEVTPAIDDLPNLQSPTANCQSIIVHHLISILNTLHLYPLACRAANGTPSSDPGQRYVRNHTAAIHLHLTSRSIRYDYSIAAPVEGFGICRRFTLRQKDRFNDRLRLEFLKSFALTRSFNRQLPYYSFKMSVVFKDRVVLPPGPYPSGIDGRHDQDGETRFSPGPSIDGLVGYSAGEDQVLLPVSPSSNGLDSPSPFERPISPPESLSTPGHRHTRPPRLGPVVKPNRVATKNREGKFVCSFPGCNDEVKVFGRKCEWNKHMDKHDRPYKCLAPGCEKLAGFTYSGGLLRHEREVHNKHGGPKNPLNCPHGNCKRHEGKGFSRMENLNEHLRRVHTPSDASNGAAGAQSPEDELDESPVSLQQALAPEKIGEKRKPETDLREEVKRLHQENQKLRDEIRAQSINSMAMMQTIGQINARLAQLTNSGLQAQPEPELQPVAQPEAPHSEVEPDLGRPHVAGHPDLSQTLG